MRAAIISFTKNGDIINNRIAAGLKGFEVIQTGKNFNKRNTDLSVWTQNMFHDCGLIVFIGATGIAVRAIAPCIRSKDSDPAIVVVDELGKYSIPILSGHIGGANRYAEMIANEIGAAPVITTATDINGLFAADRWASENGYAVEDIKEIKYISAAMLRGESVGIISDFDIHGSIPHGLEPDANTQYGICISDEPEHIYAHTLCLLPKRIIVGVGSRAGAAENALIDLFNEICRRYGIRKKSVAAVATIDLKRKEPAVVSLAEYLGTELKTYTAEELGKAEGDFTGSEFVKAITGTDNVCERAAAVCGAELGRKTNIFVKKTIGKGVTAAVAVMDWSVDFEACDERN